MPLGLTRYSTQAQFPLLPCNTSRHPPRVRGSGSCSPAVHKHFAIAFNRFGSHTKRRTRAGGLYEALKRFLFFALSLWSEGARIFPCDKRIKTRSRKHFDEVNNFLILCFFTTNRKLRRILHDFFLMQRKTKHRALVSTLNG